MPCIFVGFPIFAWFSIAILNLKKRKVERVFKFEHERKTRKIDNLTEKSGFLVRFLIFSRFLVALCIINYVYPYCC